MIGISEIDYRHATRANTVGCVQLGTVRAQRQTVRLRTSGDGVNHSVATNKVNPNKDLGTLDLLQLGPRELRSTVSGDLMGYPSNILAGLVTRLPSDNRFSTPQLPSCYTWILFL
jgi:hypothetical protein